jgi:3-oxoacyl-[acyl-carrier-protein] synthase II
MRRNVVITGLGPITAAGIGIEPLWKAACAGKSAVGRIEAFDPSGFGCEIAGQVPDFKVNKIVPKHYRKATKVMARDIELAVAAADAAVRDADLLTPGIDPENEPTYSGDRTGCHIGAGLIAADLDELTGALVEATDDSGTLDMHKWGEHGMNQLTPLWLLKYLPNMLACHVTIIHDAHGPSNTITCAEAASGLSLGESLRVIQRGAADLCFSGGADSKLNPMAYYRQVMTGRLNENANDVPATAVRPFDQKAGGTVVGEGGGIIMLEAEPTARQRNAGVYARVLGFGAGQTIYPEGKGLVPDPQGRGIAAAIRAALREADLSPEAIDLVIPFGGGVAAVDRAEVAAMREVFGDRLKDLPIWSSKPYVGTCGAGAGGIDVAMAAKMLAEQHIPARVNCDAPIDRLTGAATADATNARLNHVLVFTTSLGGQNVALVLGRASD